MREIQQQSEVIQLDKVDRKILHQLDLDARMPISKIAHNLKISRIVADYRIKKMKQAGLIRAFTSMIDPCKFGFSSWKIYLRLHNLKPETEKQMIEFLNNHNQVWWVAKCYGSYDFLYSVFAESFYEFNQVLNKFHELFGAYIAEESINNHLEPRYFFRGYLIDETPKELCMPFMKKPTKEKVDEIDISIMRKMGKNCRIPLTELAQDLKITPRIVNYRIKELMKRQLIVFNRLSLDVNKLGMDFYKGLIYLKNVEEKHLRSLIQYCKEHPYINEVVKSVGAWQMEVEVEAREFKHFNEIMEELKLHFPDLIIKIEHVLLYQEYKAEFNFLDYYQEGMRKLSPV